MKLQRKAYAEHAHLASEAMQILADCILHWDTEFRCVAANRESVLNFTGLNSHFLLGQRVVDLPIADSVRNSMRAAFEQALELPGQIITVHHRVSMNQKVHELQTEVVCEFVNDLPVGFLSITRRPQSPGMSSIAFWKSAFETRRDFWLCTDANGRIVALSDGLKRRGLGVAENGMLSDVLNEEETARFILAVKDHLVRKREHSFFLTIKGVNFKARTVYWPGFGNEAFLSLMLEDTSRKEKLNRSEEARAALMNAALAGIEDALVLCGQDGQVLFKNEASSKILPEKLASIAELASLWEGRLFAPGNNTPMEVRQLAGFHVLDGEARASDRFILRQRDETLFIESHAQGIRATEEGERYVMWLLRDISKEEERVSKLQEVNQRMDLFVRAASHDLRMPLSNIRNLAKLMQFAKNEEGRTHLAKRIEEAGNLLYELFEGMAHLASMRPEDEPEPELLNLRTMLDEILETLESEVFAAGLHIEFDLDIEEITYKKSFLRSILFNLITNAVKYRGAEHPNIRIATRPAERGMWLTIEDNGMGMDLEKRGQDLFKPFSRLTEKASGQGLGLSLVKSFVEQNGGEIHVESELGKGSAFKLLLRAYASNTSQYELF